MSPFDDTVVAAIVKDMNAEHRDDALLICRTLGRQPSARTARLVGFNPSFAIFSARIDGGDVDVKVPWSAPVTEPGRVREEIFGMYRAVCAQARIKPRKKPGSTA